MAKVVQQCGGNLIGAVHNTRLLSMWGAHIGFYCSSQGFEGGIRRMFLDTAVEVGKLPITKITENMKAVQYLPKHSSLHS